MSILIVRHILLELKLFKLFILEIICHLYVINAHHAPPLVILHSVFFFLPIKIKEKHKNHEQGVFER